VRYDGKAEILGMGNEGDIGKRMQGGKLRRTWHGKPNVIFSLR